MDNGTAGLKATLKSQAVPKILLHVAGNSVFSTEPLLVEHRRYCQEAKREVSYLVIVKQLNVAELWFIVRFG